MGRTINILFTVIGGVASCLWIAVLAKHQYAVYSYRRHYWIPTVVLALESIWMFLIGLVGLVRQRKNQNAP